MTKCCKYVRFDQDFLNLPEIAESIEKYKSVGAFTILLLMERLLHRTHTIGILNNLGSIHTMIGVQKRTLVKLIREIPAFKTDEKNGLFWIPRLRKELGLTADPTDEEIEYIMENGNIYFGDSKMKVCSKTVTKKGKKAKAEKYAEREMCACPETETKDYSEGESMLCSEAEKQACSEDETQTCSETEKQACSEAEKQACTNAESTKKTQSISNHSSKLALQLADNQQKQGIHKDIDISNSNIEITSNKANPKQVSDYADDAGEKEFKEILSDYSWCKSVSKRMGIDLQNKQTMSKFSEWMYAYCVSSEKMPKNARELRKYAANLLRQGRKTRAEIDKYLSAHESETPVDDTPETVEHSEYERVFNGIRFSAAGNRLPKWAPLQPALGVSFSYLKGGWIPNDEYDWHKETAKVEYLEKYKPEYFEMMGGAA